MNTKEKILILDVMRYADKKSGEIKSRLGFILCSQKHKKNTDNFKGFNELSCFYDLDILDKVPQDTILEPVDGIFELRPNQSNPMRTNSILVGFEYKGNVYKLL